MDVSIVNEVVLMLMVEIVLVLFKVLAVNCISASCGGVDLQVHAAGSRPAEGRQPGEHLPSGRRAVQTHRRVHHHPGLQ